MRRRCLARRWIVGAVACALLGCVADARADEPTTEQCVAANEGAQTLRQNGKLQAARAQLLLCLAKSCPGALRKDCSERLDDVQRAIPTIVFSAKAAAGADLSAVRVTMDGAPLAPRLDGSALSIEPGEHIFDFNAEGYAPVSKRLVISEGVKGRQEGIAFIAATAAGSGPGASAAPVAPDAPASNGRRTVGLAVVGVGVVGVAVGAVFGVRALSKSSDAKSTCSLASCADAEAVSASRDAITSANVANVAIGVGVLALGVGTFLVLTSSGAKQAARGAPNTVATRIAPLVGRDAGGVSLAGAW